ncbi:hypothetical protein [Thermogemmatispora carboxidivorans]|uniref:hypothetical protein n=1 Tax=Thermogemmatispora carboxidivorans TaxID=1382306 RepID=UPI00069C7365|nr:hypothetical protein [Thermogemmatispora carboxidivorans]
MRYTVVLLALAFFLFLSALSAKGGEAAAVHGCASLPPPAVSSALPPPLRPHAILLNEVLTWPASSWNCSSASLTTPNRDAWVELYNPLNQPVDLYAVHAALDTGPQTPLFLLPLSSVLPAHGFLVVFPDSQFFFPNVPFTLRLLFNGSAVIDEVNVPLLNSDESFARISDGAPVWHSTTDPTPGSSNAPSLQPSPPPTSKAASPTASSSSSQRTRSGGTAASSSQATPTPAITGTQPAWDTLRLPSSAATATGTATGTSDADRSALSSLSSSSSMTPQEEESTSGAGFVHLVVVAGLALALVASCFWCWRLFRSPPRTGG